MADVIRIEVAYALPHKQKIIALDVAVGTTVQEAVIASNIVADFPELDLATSKFGIFSKATPSSEVLRQGDRVEIYRPLLIDPKQARLNRAAKAQE